jgi:hypothetical protein
VNCSQIRDLLPEYAVQLLDARARDAVERHLEFCVGCRAELKAQDDVMALVEQYGARQPPVGLFNGIRNRIEVGDGARPRPAWWAWLFRRPARVLAMSTAVGALALALLMPTPSGTLSSSPGIEIHQDTGNEVTSTALASSIRLHAVSAGEGPVTDRVAWEAVAQLATQDGSPRAGVE